MIEQTDHTGLAARPGIVRGTLWELGENLHTTVSIFRTSDKAKPYHNRAYWNLTVE